MADSKNTIDISGLFKSKEDEKKGDKPKVPVNIFSKPINVTQTEEARKSRLKTVIIEGLLFGAFLTAITAIYSLSGLELEFDPENGGNTPSLLFFLFEFVLFSGLVGVGDYFLTEKRVNDYNQKNAGWAFDINAEIEKALDEQASEGITEEQAAVLNKTNGETVPEVGVEIVPGSANGPTDKLFEAFIDGKKAGSVSSCKGIILNSNGLEEVVLLINALNIEEEYNATNVDKQLFSALKASAVSDGFSAVVMMASIYPAEKIGMVDASKFGISAKSKEDMKISELYPGALMNVSGELQN